MLRRFFNVMQFEMQLEASNVNNGVQDKQIIQFMETCQTISQQ